MSRPTLTHHSATPEVTSHWQAFGMLQPKHQPQEPQGLARKQTYHDGGVKVAEHIAAHLEEAGAHKVGVFVQLPDLLGAAAGAVLVHDQLERTQNLLRCRRRHRRCIQVCWEGPPEVVDYVPAASLSHAFRISTAERGRDGGSGELNKRSLSEVAVVGDGVHSFTQEGCYF